MTAELCIAILGLLAILIIVIFQIKLSKEQKAINNRIDKMESRVKTGNGNNMRGIIGNTNVGAITNNII